MPLLVYYRLLIESRGEEKWTVVELKGLKEKCIRMQYAESGCGRILMLMSSGQTEPKAHREICINKTTRRQTEALLKERSKVEKQRSDVEKLRRHTRSRRSCIGPSPQGYPIDAFFHKISSLA
jgi:hypothetical protein